MAKHELYSIRVFEASYSTKQFADLAGISTKTLTHIENGYARTVHIATARSLIAALQLRLPHVTIEDVFTEHQLCENSCKFRKCLDYRLASNRVPSKPKQLDGMHSVRRYRKKTGLTQSELASAADLSPSVVSRIERRTKEWHIHRDTARALYYVLKSRMPQLMFDDLFDEEELSDRGGVPHIKQEYSPERMSSFCPECHLEMPSGKRRCDDCDWEDPKQGLRLVKGA